MIATVARLLCWELTLQNEYLLLENRTLKSKIPGRLRFTDEERRCLTEAALAMGRSLMKEVVSIVKPETILAWQRRLEQKKWDYSARRAAKPGRPRTPDDVEALVCRLARENRSRRRRPVWRGYAGCGPVPTGDTARTARGHRVVHPAGASSHFASPPPSSANIACSPVNRSQRSSINSQ